MLDEQELERQKLRSEFNDFLTKAQDLYRSDPSRVSYTSSIKLLQTKQKIKFRNESGLILFKVTNEVTVSTSDDNQFQCHRFKLGEKHQALGP